ncbi:LPA [Branchiostoma lanceolatum]|uniref:LPA protein n=1 Tax=Branchiostoma lanceolatum TaxID=7740 RepID=A0A8K0EDD7_BRALA|nr:LPA [Branchiostoma lanceolatum]
MNAEAESKSVETGDITTPERTSSQQNDDEEAVGTEAISTYTVTIARGIINTMYACGSPGQTEDEEPPTIPTQHEEDEIERIDADDPNSHVYQSVDEDDIENQRQARMDGGDGQQPNDNKKDTTLPIKARKNASGLRNNPMYASGGQVRDKDSFKTCCMDFSRSCLLRGVIITVVVTALFGSTFLTVLHLTSKPENGTKTHLLSSATFETTREKTKNLKKPDTLRANKVVTKELSWVVNSTGTPLVRNGVIHDAGKALDGDTKTYWNPLGMGQYYNNWNIVLDLAAPKTLTRIAVINYGDTKHDIVKFTLQRSEVLIPYIWKDVVHVTDVQGGTDQHQQFGGFQETAQYWRFVVTHTNSGWQPWLKELYLYPVSSYCQAGDGASYRGTVNMTDTGKTCQRWDSITPHGHSRTAAGYVLSGLEQNYCRNPDGEAGVWCYTMDPSTRWEYCNVPVCAATCDGCPAGYKFLARTCIRLDFRQKNHWDAMEACEKEGAELVMPKTKELDVAVRILVRTESHRQSFWIGMRDKGGLILHKRHWQWVDGTTLGNYKMT